MKTACAVLLGGEGAYFIAKAAALKVAMDWIPNAAQNGQSYSLKFDFNMSAAVGFALLIGAALIYQSK